MLFIDVTLLGSRRNGYCLRCGEFYADALAPIPEQRGDYRERAAKSSGEELSRSQCDFQRRGGSLQNKLLSDHSYVDAENAFIYLSTAFSRGFELVLECTLLIS
jgi:hypothetical protein